MQQRQANRVEDGGVGRCLRAEAPGRERAPSNGVKDELALPAAYPASRWGSITSGRVRTSCE
jgi:hypothetical protein